MAKRFAASSHASIDARKREEAALARIITLRSRRALERFCASPANFMNASVRLESCSITAS
jgi:hypothetical protein